MKLVIRREDVGGDLDWQVGSVGHEFDPIEFVRLNPKRAQPGVYLLGWWSASTAGHCRHS